MKTVKVRGWEINIGAGRGRRSIQLGIQRTRLIGGWSVRCGVPHVFYFGVMWYK